MQNIFRTSCWELKPLKSMVGECSVQCTSAVPRDAPPVPTALASRSRVVNTKEKYLTSFATLSRRCAKDLQGKLARSKSINSRKKAHYTCDHHSTVDNNISLFSLHCRIFHNFEYKHLSQLCSDQISYSCLCVRELSPAFRGLRLVPSLWSHLSSG